MHPDLIRQLEERLDTAIAEVLEKHLSRPPVSPRTRHLMAKAAVTVLEAVQQEQGREDRRIEDQ
jgi:hypothetical protein